MYIRPRVNLAQTNLKTSRSQAQCLETYSSKGILSGTAPQYLAGELQRVADVDLRIIITNVVTLSGNLISLGLISD